MLRGSGGGGGCERVGVEANTPTGVLGLYSN